MSKPIVAVPTCRYEIDGVPYDCTQHKYIAALERSADVQPILLPLQMDQLDMESILSIIDGMMLSGSPSNIHPANYAVNSCAPDFKLDRERDMTILPLIKPAIQLGIPVLAACRGFQEVNVAYGGTLYPEIDRVDSLLEHKEDKSLAVEQRYAPAHSITLATGGYLQQLLNTDTITVNSLHNQGVKMLGEGLIAEAYADDGLIEAFRVADSKSFALGVQWHPEWQSTNNPVSTVIYAEFGKACRRRLATK